MLSAVLTILNIHLDDLSESGNMHLFIIAFIDNVMCLTGPVQDLSRKGVLFYVLHTFKYSIILKKKLAKYRQTHIKT